jgi:carbohydrate kinase (thermoresistant glucokinase family)
MGRRLRQPLVILIMGVSGSGKTTLGSLLSERIGARFGDADAFHPAANVEKMSNGIPLTDDDRWPWLDGIAATISRWAADDTDVVFACSALKRIYRDRLRAGRTEMKLIHLTGGKDLIASRMQQRTGHFMPAGLLRSQLATLEPPGADEGAITLDIKLPPEMLLEESLTFLHLD